MKLLYYFPHRHLMLSVPFALFIGLVIGLFFDMSFLAPTILVGTIVMIYPTMIGFPIKQAFNLTDRKLIFSAIGFNFIVIPLIAWGIGLSILGSEPLMFAGLAIAALLPTSGMTISWTAMSNGNVSSAIKLTVFGLLIGAILAPFYLLAMVGQYVHVELFGIIRTVATVVLIPMILGGITFRIMKRSYTEDVIRKQVKPKWQPLSMWGMVYIVFASTSMRADILINHLEQLGLAVIALIIFYALIFTISTLIGRHWFALENAYAFVYGTALRNLSIAMGIAVTTFGTEAALLITLAFLVQQQMVVFYSRGAKNYHWLGSN
ncbi:arsenic resistance protein [Texcoconibacillus texcoconensis]|uniref:ACR3 family arsenite efflux pump ArsB n=1 Tax=Texcoconibacillus texcoconensis TaxID=1095777 RepID=A0A840QNR3_9BACI|nr:ACR3 family arsenite efflux pump ArsB [Texcoconibacillus texcoconensis]